MGAMCPPYIPHVPSPGDAAPRYRRGLVIATAFLASAMTFIEGSSFSTMVVPIQDEFDLSVDDASTLQVFPEMAGLLVVFVAAALAVRLGQRTVLLGAGVVFTAGSLLMTVAPSPGLLTVARLLVGLGTVTLTVLGLSLINLTFDGSAARGRAFGVLAALAPVVALVMPNISAAMCATVGWRAVSLIWALLAIALLGLTILAAPGRDRLPTGGDMITPILAGVALASLCLSATTLANPGVVTAVAIGISLVSAVGLAIILPRRKNPGLDLRALHTSTGRLAGAALILIWCVSLTFYVGLFLQFRYDYGVVTATLVLTLCEAAAVAGGFFFGSLSSRIGPQRSGMVALVAASLLGFGLVVAAAFPAPWLVILLTALISFPNVGAVGPLTQHFLNQAPDDGSDGASSMADALSNVGFVAGGALVSLVVFTSFSTTLSAGLQEFGYDAPRADTISAQIRGGLSSENLVARDEAADPLIRAALADDSALVERAQAQALGTMGWAFTVTFGGAALLMLPGLRRREVAAPRAPQPDR